MVVMILIRMFCVSVILIKSKLVLKMNMKGRVIVCRE